MNTEAIKGTDLRDRIEVALNSIRPYLEADGGNVTGLFGAEDVAGAPDLEVGQGDLEARSKLGRVEDHLEPLPGVVAHPLTSPVQQVRIGAPRRPAAPHPSDQCCGDCPL